MCKKPSLPPPSHEYITFITTIERVQLNEQQSIMIPVSVLISSQLYDLVTHIENWVNIGSNNGLADLGP